MSCCDDPTETPKVDPRDLRREQENYGNLLRDLFTEDPEKLMGMQLRKASHYLKELAALRAHYDSIRIQAIHMLDNDSKAILEQIITREKDAEIKAAAQQRIAELT